MPLADSGRSGRPLPVAWNSHRRDPYHLDDDGTTPDGWARQADPVAEAVRDNSRLHSAVFGTEAEASVAVSEAALAASQDKHRTLGSGRGKAVAELASVGNTCPAASSVAAANILDLATVALEMAHLQKIGS